MMIKIDTRTLSKDQLLSKIEKRFNKEIATDIFNILKPLDKPGQFLKAAESTQRAKSPPVLLKPSAGEVEREIAAVERFDNVPSDRARYAIYYFIEEILGFSELDSQMLSAESKTRAEKYVDVEGEAEELVEYTKYYSIANESDGPYKGSLKYRLVITHTFLRLEGRSRKPNKRKTQLRKKASYQAYWVPIRSKKNPTPPPELVLVPYPERTVFYDASIQEAVINEASDEKRRAWDEASNIGKQNIIALAKNLRSECESVMKDAKKPDEALRDTLIFKLFMQYNSLLLPELGKNILDFSPLRFQVSGLVVPDQASDQAPEDTAKIVKLRYREPKYKAIEAPEQVSQEAAGKDESIESADEGSDTKANESSTKEKKPKTEKKIATKEEKLEKTSESKVKKKKEPQSESKLEVASEDKDEFKGNEDKQQQKTIQAMRKKIDAIKSQEADALTISLKSELEELIKSVEYRTQFSENSFIIAGYQEAERSKIRFKSIVNSTNLGFSKASPTSQISNPTGLDMILRLTDSQEILQPPINIPESTITNEAKYNVRAELVKLIYYKTIVYQLMSAYTKWATLFEDIEGASYSAKEEGQDKWQLVNVADDKMEKSYVYIPDRFQSYVIKPKAYSKLMLEYIKLMLQNPDITNQGHQAKRKDFLKAQSWIDFRAVTEKIQQKTMELPLELFPSLLIHPHIIDTSYQTIMELPSYRKLTVSEITQSKTIKASRNHLFYRACMFSKAPLSIDLILCSNENVSIRPTVDELNNESFEASEFFSNIVPLAVSDILFYVKIDAMLKEGKVDISFKLSGTRVGIAATDEEIGDSMQHWMLHIAGLPGILGKMYRLFGRYYDQADASYKGISEDAPMLEVPIELIGKRTDLSRLPKHNKAVSYLTWTSLQELLTVCLSGGKTSVGRRVDIDVPDSYPIYESGE